MKAHDEKPKKNRFRIELLEDRIAPGAAPGLMSAAAGIPPGESLNAIFSPGNGSTAGPIWFGAVSGQFPC